MHARIGRAVGVDPHHQRRTARVAEPGALAVAAAVAGPVPRHRHAVALRQQERPGSPGDRERNRRLAGGPARILDLQLGRARPDRLQLAAHVGRGAVSGVEADERGSRDLHEHPPHRTGSDGCTVRRLMRARILIVDDDPGVRTVAEDVLTAAGFEVTGTGSAASALELLQSGRSTSS